MPMKEQPLQREALASQIAELATDLGPTGIEHETVHGFSPCLRLSTLLGWIEGKPKEPQCELGTLWRTSCGWGFDAHHPRLRWCPIKIHSRLGASPSHTPSFLKPERAAPSVDGASAFTLRPEWLESCYPAGLYSASFWSAGLFWKGEAGLPFFVIQGNNSVP